MLLVTLISPCLLIAVYGLSRLVQHEVGVRADANAFWVKPPEPADREMKRVGSCDGSTRRAQGSTALP